MERQFYERGHWLFLGMYLFGLFALVHIYGGWKIGYLRVFNVIFSQAVGIIVINAITYLAIVLLTKSIPNILYLLLMTVIQILVTIPWTLISNRIYLTAYPPRRVLMVYGDRPAMSLMRKITSRTDRFTVAGKIPIHRGIEMIERQIPKYEGVVICDIESHERNQILKYCYEKNVRAYVLPKISDIIIRSCESQHMFDTPMLMARNEGLTIEGKAAKRLEDIILALLLLIIFSPFMLIIAIAIKLEDGGSIIYKQERLTIDRKHFYVYKFRSMQENAENDGIARLAAAHDCRITRVGKIIRAIRFDELPQFVNILKGDMSIVGPRPERPEIAEEYEKKIPEFAYRLKVKAGLTGYAQVYGKYNTTAYDKLKLDLMYIQNYNIALDLEIILKTIQTMFTRESTEGMEEGEDIALGP
jgi:exopolysaccharide biosynthesis polyprenyl glycosylphosphotransferase